MKKRSIVQKLFAIAAAAALSLSLSACNGNSVSSSDGPGVTPGGSQESSQPNGGKTYKVAIIKQMDHASLDEIAQAVEQRLDEIAAQNGVAIQHETTSGQNDQGTLKQLADQAIADGADVIIPIATTAAKIAALSAGETKTPVVFAAVSYPAEESVALTGLDYVTGTSDALNTKFIIDLMLAQNPELSKVGLLYCLSEDNSATPIAEAKEYLDSKSIPYSVQTANSNDEVVAAVSALIAEGVDAVFTPTDNVVPHYGGADSFARNGAFAGCGVNYTLLGGQTADLAYDVLTKGMDGMEDYYLLEGGIITVNTETAAALNIDYTVFQDMGTVAEVQTTED